MQLFASLERPRSPADHGKYLRTLAEDLAALGITGLLIVQHPKHLGVWASAGVLAAHTDLQPLIAVSPDHTHPVTACREAVSLASLYRRPVGLNLIAGANTGDVKHAADSKYERFREFVTIVTELLGSGHVSYRGDTYQVEDANLDFASEASRSLVWTVVAGSSDAAAQVSAACKVPRVTHLTPETLTTPTWAVHVGIITRPARKDAWARARTLFPVANRDATSSSDAAWMRAIAAADGKDSDPSYFTYPFMSGQRPYPYLVGSYEEIRQRLGMLCGRGCKMLVLQRSGEMDDLRHAAHVLADLRESCSATQLV